MKKDAEAHAEEDKKRKEEIETINQADTLVYTSEKLFKDFEGKVDKKEIEQLKGKILELKELLKPDKKDVSAIKKKMDECNTLAHKMSTELYKKASEAQKTQASAKADEPKTGKEKKEKTVEAEYKVTDEKKGKKK